MKKTLIIIFTCFILTSCSNQQVNMKSGANEQNNSTSSNINSAQQNQQQNYDDYSVNSVAHLQSLPDEYKSSDLIEVREKMFIAQTNDIYLNYEDYLGKTIKYEGLFDVYVDDYMDYTFYSVIRYGPGCCGTDGNAGFEVSWDQEFPENNSWVEVVGVLGKYQEGDFEFLRLNVQSINVLETRGLEFVTQ